jgi:hypothetical protein
MVVIITAIINSPVITVFRINAGKKIITAAVTITSHSTDSAKGPVILGI